MAAVERKEAAAASSVQVPDCTCHSLVLGASPCGTPVFPVGAECTMVEPCCSQYPFVLECLKGHCQQTQCTCSGLLHNWSEEEVDTLKCISFKCTVFVPIMEAFKLSWGSRSVGGVCCSEHSAVWVIPTLSLAVLPRG